MANLCPPLSAGEDTFELHSLQLELEAMEKQIQELLVRQTELRERRAALESSQVSIQRDTNTLTTSTPCASLHRSRAPWTRSSQMSFTPAPGHHGPWVQQQRKTRARPRPRTSPPPPPPVFEISTRNRSSPATRIIVSGPLPTYRRGHERLFRADGLHPSRVGAELLSDNISRTLRSI
ncbi:hypothetical protein M9458_057692 [Cirrhinus mrigala]|uniref:Uncharacterized protein n=1 Tax=Cirrhinus mrigala TaxID=683832 RepID=A0ABD0MFX4_CIRMR